MVWTMLLHYQDGKVVCDISFWRDASPCFIMTYEP
jgi:hypothetical protein